MRPLRYLNGRTPSPVPAGARQTRAEAGGRSGASPDAAEVARPGRAVDLPAAESDNRTSVRSAEAAKRNAAICSPRVARCGGRVGPGRHGLQPDADMDRRLAAHDSG